MEQPLTLFEKVWNNHIVLQETDSPAILYIDLHLVHEVTSPQAFDGLRRRGLKVRRPDRTVGTMDHSIPTLPPSVPISDELAAKQMRQMEINAQEFGFRLYGKDHPQRGIVHVIGPELGLSQPGMTIVCGDSHTATHGAFGALAFGIGTSEVEHVLATQCLLQRKPKTMEVRIEGTRSLGVTAKDIILALLAKIGVGGGTGHVIEYTGSVVRALSMEERMTICNMSIEGGARAGMMAPDDTTFQYLANKEFAPKGKEWDKAVAYWRTLPTDSGAQYDRTITLDISSLEPMITFGTNPGMGIPITATIPDPAKIQDNGERQSFEKSLLYMGFQPGERLLGKKIDVVFIGSCTNSRISDLREAAKIFKGRKVAPGVRVLVVPGSQTIKRQAEEEGLADIFKSAGAEWRESGCSMCIAMNGDEIKAGQYAVSTSNRNFEGRQGKGGRTLLASPLVAAAAAVTGKITDVRTLLSN
ncbi:MAG TPA: 3-isopropylmalate dehydratase large subunit [Bacteroidota bacterium]|nr:3-isopropylmalate dehydratase large subunit [Bacteroidota bacterium]